MLAPIPTVSMQCRQC